MFRCLDFKIEVVRFGLKARLNCSSGESRCSPTTSNAVTLPLQVYERNQDVISIGFSNDVCPKLCIWREFGKKKPMADGTVIRHGNPYRVAHEILLNKN